MNQFKVNDQVNLTHLIGAENAGRLVKVTKVAQTELGDEPRYHVVAVDAANPLVAMDSVPESWLVKIA